MMRSMVLGIVAVACFTGAASAQVADPIEIPLRMEEGRMLITAQAADGSDFELVLGLGMPVLTESARARLGARGQLTLGGVPVEGEETQVVPDASLATGSSTPDGVLGGATINGFDVLVDVPGGRLVLKPVGRSVRWDGVSLSSPVPLTVFHDLLLRVDVNAGGRVVGGLLDLANPGLEVNEGLRAVTADGTLASFRMGYAGWTDLPVEVKDTQTLRAWDRNGEGFVVVGAAIAEECAIAISWRHSELRTCMR